VSCGAGIALVTEAQKAGVDVTCETCPHYLALSEHDVLKLGAVAKCAPPLRAIPVQAELWQQVAAGKVTTIGSDHSPAPPEMKTDTNFFKVWGGISGAQHTLPLLLTEGYAYRDVALPLISRLLSFNVAQRFGLPASKGEIKIGADADLALVDLNKGFIPGIVQAGWTSYSPIPVIVSDDLFYRHKQSPYLGRKLRGRVEQTLLRGQTIFKDGKITSKGLGQLVRPLTP
jgi:allantoinase